MQEFLWVVYPYLTLGLFVVGSLYRYNFDQIGWTSKSSEILEKRLLRWGSLLFHWGVIFVFFGHVFGLLVPIGVYRALGVPDELYHLVALWSGGITGLAAFTGLALLIWRRLTNLRVRLASSASDVLVLALLLLTVGLGLGATLGLRLAGVTYEYRTSVGPWIRSVLLGHPQASLMQGVPLILQLHILAALLLFATTPFSRLVHVFSLPLAYLRRAPQQYRSRWQENGRRSQGD